MNTLFVGEINPDLVFSGLQNPLTIDRETLATDFGLRIGSSTAICACAFGGLGGDASFAGMVGDDYFGSFMVQQLDRYGIGTEYVVKRGDIQTGATACLNYADTRTQVTYLGTIAEFDGANVTQSVLSGFQHVHSAGVFLQTGLLPELRRIFGEAHRQGLSTSLDTQWDPTEKWDALEELIPTLDTLFVNQAEHTSICRAYGSVSFLHQLNPALDLIVKKGHEGAELFNATHENVHAIAHEVERFVDTTGAGDNFDAGYLYARYVRGTNREFALKFGNAVAAANCAVVGGVAEIETYRNILEVHGL